MVVRDLVYSRKSCNKYNKRALTINQSSFWCAKLESNRYEFITRRILSPTLRVFIQTISICQYFRKHTPDYFRAVRVIVNNVYIMFLLNQNKTAFLFWFNKNSLALLFFRTTFENPKSLYFVIFIFVISLYGNSVNYKAFFS